MADKETKPAVGPGQAPGQATAAPGGAAATAAATTTSTSSSPSSPSSSDKSSGSGGSGSGNGSGGSGSSGNKTKGDNKFYSLFQSIQKNIETLNYVTKEIEKINDRILFRSSTITPAEESSLIRKVSHIHKDTSMKARDTSRLIKNLRVETSKPTPVTPGSETKSENEKSEEEKAEESRDVGDKENICKTVTRSFTDELLLYQSAIQDFKNELKERLTKRVQSIRPKASEDFIDLSLRSESSRYALFREIMATDEKDLSEEDAKALKDEIAEKYVVIAELSAGAAEMNKIFLNLASTSNPASTSLSDSEAEEDQPPRTSTRGFASRNPYRGSSSSTRSSTRRASFVIDDLLGNLNLNRGSSNKDTTTDSGNNSSYKDGMDSSANSQSTNGGGQRRNRLFAFMRRHRQSSTATAKRLRFDTADVRSSKQRRVGGRASRWMTLFLLATVAVAALVGIVMLH